MKKLLLCSFVIGLLIICISFSGEQEFIKQPKEKRFCPSRQQLVELSAVIVTNTNEILSILSGFLSDIVDIQKLALKEINGYVEGDKECFLNNTTKKQRSDVYIKKMELKEELKKIEKQLLLLKEKFANYKAAFQ